MSLAGDLVRLIRIPSVTTDSNARAARAAAAMFRKAGFRVALQSVRKNGKTFYNVTGLKGGRGRPLMLCAHLDTVPPGDFALWTRTGRNPWRAARKGTVVYGLGSADDKASLVAMLHAAGRVAARELKRPLLLLGTFGEESGMGGAWLFRRAWKGPKPFAAIVGEPTSLTLTYRHKGMGVVELRVRGGKSGRVSKRFKKIFMGKQGHSSRPWLGVNALEKVLAFLRSGAGKNGSVLRMEGGAAANLIPGRGELEHAAGHPGGFPAALVTACDDAVKKVLKKFSRRRDASFHPPTITSNLGVARTGKNFLSFQYDFRLLPGQSVLDIERRIRAELRGGLRHFPRFRASTRVERSNPPLGGSVRDPLVRFAAAVLRTSGVRPKLVTKPSCTEAGVYERWGVPALIFGPGNAAGNIHAPNESVDLRQIARAASLYEAMIRAACAGDKPCL